MDAALGTLDRLFTDLGAVQLDVLDADQLGTFAIGLGKGIDRLTAFHAKVVHAADERKSWTGSGARDMEDWLSQRTGTSRGTAKSRKKLGEALESSKKLEEAVDNGELSAASAEQLHEAVTSPPEGTDAEDLEELIDAAKGSRPADAKQAADRWREIHAKESADERSERRYRRRSVTSKPADDGMVETTVVLPELQHRQVLNALNHAAGRYHADDDRTPAQRMADGLINLAAAYASGTVTGGREKPTLLIGCTAETIAGLSDEPGWTAHGDRIPADVLRHLAENAILRRIVDAGSAIIDLGSKVRFFTDDQYEALMVRDGGCRFPGCTIPAAWCEADHLVAVTEGGPTDLDNAALWCSYHHQLKHRSGVQVIGDAHDLYLRLPDGRLIHCPPKGISTRRAQPAPPGRPVRPGRPARPAQAAA